MSLCYIHLASFPSPVDVLPKSILKSINIPFKSSVKVLEENFIGSYMSLLKSEDPSNQGFKRHCPISKSLGVLNAIKGPFIFAKIGV